MKNILRKVDFELEKFNGKFNGKLTNIINTNLIMYYNDLNYKYKIINYLGKGTVGQVYMIEPIDYSTNKKYVIKISNLDYKEDLKDEVELTKYYFNKYNIKHKSHPLFFGNFNNLNANGIIYPYLGFYNLEKINKIKYKICWKHNIKIIIQLINQLIDFKNIIHGDLKSSNVVVDIIKNDIIVSIIDFGLIKDYNSTNNIISTNYITSPESLLSLDKYINCRDNTELINFYKHDYYGLYTIILDLLLKNNYWNIINSYFNNHVKINSDDIINHESIDIFCYTFYKFFYNNHEKLSNNQYKKLINKIELKYPDISKKRFTDFDTFYKLYIEPNIDHTRFNSNNLPYFKNFLIKICHFDPNKRSNLKELLLDPFLN
jgi:serine/threonine protein kinase